MSNETHISGQDYERYDRKELPTKIIIDAKGVRKAPGTMTLEAAIHVAKSIGRMLETNAKAPGLHFVELNQKELGCIGEEFRKAIDAIEFAFMSHVFIKRNPDLRLQDTSPPVERRYSAKALTAMHNAIVPDNESGQVFRELLKTTMEVLDMPTDKLTEPAQAADPREGLKKMGNAMKREKGNNNLPEHT